MWVEENIQSSGSSQACFDFSPGSPRSPQHVPYFPNQHKMYGELIWHIYNSVISRSPHHIFGLNLNQDGSLRLANLCCSSPPPRPPPIHFPTARYFYWQCFWVFPSAPNQVRLPWQPRPDKTTILGN